MKFGDKVRIKGGFPEVCLVLRYIQHDGPTMVHLVNDTGRAFWTKARNVERIEDEV